MIPSSVHKRPRPHFPLYRLLKQRGRSQYSLAKETQLSLCYVNRIARGKILPGWKVVCLIAAALGADLGDFKDQPMPK